MVKSRLGYSQKRLDKNLELKQKYTTIIEDYVTKNYAEKPKKNTKMRSYLPHHAVLHPQKPDKVRVAFDCKATFKGKSLNQQLLRGPNLLNSFIRVLLLLRLRKEKFFMVTHIKALFHQDRVDPRDRDFLWFLWWLGGNKSLPSKEYYMKVYLFGAALSPNCANFAVLQTAKNNSNSCEPSNAQTVKKNFYMDDCLKSVANEEKAMNLYQQLTD